MTVRRLKDDRPQQKERGKVARRRNIGLIGTLGLVLLTLGACSSNSPGGLPLTLSPGHGSPQAAAAGAMTGIQRNQPSLICQ